MAQQGVAADAPTMSEDDRDRWAFYSKIKDMAALGSTEANLFWLLLDETHGDDYCAFFLHCLQGLVAIAGDGLSRQLGVAARGLTYKQTALLAAKDAPKLRRSDGSIDRAVLTASVDSCVKGQGTVFLYLAQAYAALDCLLVGPLEPRLAVVKAAIKSLAHPATESKLDDFDDGRGARPEHASAGPFARRRRRDARGAHRIRSSFPLVHS
mmetsp:Transcript_2930/g.8702  ORF Transcript_2930/g.8702 Transcript_2930/m.8702 type:complete len:210 (+) Transcript_2930:199-828(+)